MSERRTHDGNEQKRDSVELWNYLPRAVLLEEYGEQAARISLLRSSFVCLNSLNDKLCLLAVCKCEHEKENQDERRPAPCFNKWELHFKSCIYLEEE